MKTSRQCCWNWILQTKEDSLGKNNFYSKKKFYRFFLTSSWKFPDFRRLFSRYVTQNCIFRVQRNKLRKIFFWRNKNSRNFSEFDWNFQELRRGFWPGRQKATCVNPEESFFWKLCFGKFLEFIIISWVWVKKLSGKMWRKIFVSVLNLSDVCGVTSEIVTTKETVKENLFQTWQYFSKLMLLKSKTSH